MDRKNVKHADDSTFALKNTDSLKKINDMLDQFGNTPETKLNVSKTECILSCRRKKISCLRMISYKYQYFEKKKTLQNSTLDTMIKNVIKKTCFAN